MKDEMLKKIQAFLKNAQEGNPKNSWKSSENLSDLEAY